MKNLIHKYQDVLKETLIFLLLAILYVVVLVAMNNTFGMVAGDFQAQHVRFIDYLRNAFFKTHDLAPQMTMNLGGTQNMATLYYHGQYNPLIMLSYLFPFISTINWLRIVLIFLATTSFLAMNVLLKQHQIAKTTRIIVSIMTVVTMPFLYHSGNHIIFLYYYPVMITSLIGLRMIIKHQKMWLFIICVALIFYTNFFFALVIGFMQLVYFIVCLYYENHFNRRDRLKRYLKLVLSYLIGILIGAFILLPQVFIVLDAPRAADFKNAIPFFYKNWVEQFVLNRYAGGLGVIALAALIMSVLNYKDKFNLILILAVFMCIVIGPFNYLLNVFLYLHDKVLIYTIPLIMLVLARILNSKQKDYKFAIVIIITMIYAIYLIYFDHTQPYKTEKYRYLMMAYPFVQSIVLLFLYYKPNLKIPLWVSVFVLLGLLSKNNPNLIPNAQVDGTIRHQKLLAKDFHLDKKDDFYRTISDINFVRAINEYSPSLYASMGTGEMNKFNLKTVEMETYKFSRSIRKNAFKNIFMRNLFGINTYVSTETGQETHFDNVRPFIYGVYNNELYNEQSLEQQSKFERLFSLNEHVYTAHSKKIAPKKNYHIKNILNDSKIYQGKNLDGKVIKIPKQYQKDGLIILQIKNIAGQAPLTQIKVNSHTNYFYSNNIYGEGEHKVGYYFFDASPKLKKLVFEVKPTEQPFTDIKMDFIPQQAFDKNFMQDYIKPDNIKIDSNKAYEFDLNMKENGMLVTSIFYDKGFNILVDDRKVPNEKVNINFLGSNLAKGHHHIKITYTMAGFIPGLVISVLGLFVLAFIMIDEIKWLNKPFFRFVLVGVFNTINYFLMFTFLHKSGVEYVLAHLCAFLYSAFVSYFITTYYTFKTKPSLRTMIRFPITYLPNLILSTLGTILLVENNIISESIASLVVMIISIPITFLLSKLIFNKKHRE